MENRYILTFYFDFAPTVAPERKNNFLQKFFFLIQRPLPWILKKLPLHPFAGVKQNVNGVVWTPTESQNVMQCITNLCYDDISTTMKVYFFMLVGASRLASLLHPVEFSFQFNVLTLP